MRPVHWDTHARAYTNSYQFENMFEQMDKPSLREKSLLCPKFFLKLLLFGSIKNKQVKGYLQEYTLKRSIKLKDFSCISCIFPEYILHTDVLFLLLNS